METKILADICQYRRETISVEHCNIETFISTENMLPNKAGISPASKCPTSGNVSKYYPGDVLVSNIRPYFKKIYLADTTGTCSNDVLVFHPKHDVCTSEFLYCVLSTDEFFSYATTTAKGTKMPRGDRSAIMNYQINWVPIHDQSEIAETILNIYRKIKLNEKINDNLQRQAQLTYNIFFEKTDFHHLPSGWSVVPLGDVATISTKAFNPQKEPITILEHYSIPAFDENKFPTFESSSNIKSNKFIIDSSCFLISKLNPTTKRVWKPYCLSGCAVCSTEFIVYRAKDNNLSDFLYSVIDSQSFTNYMCAHVNGTTGSRQRTTPSETLSYKLLLPSQDILEKFQSTVSPMYNLIRINSIENNRLRKLRDTLLQKLLSGKMDAKDTLMR